MSVETADLGKFPDAALSPTAQPSRLHPLIGYAAGAGLVALATGAAFLVAPVVPNLGLVFVLPVLLTALAFGWGPALVSAFLAVAAFDFFFVEPHYTLRVGSTSDLWAMSLLLVVAGIASGVAAQSRRRALDAQAAANRAEALHRLAHAVVEAAPANEICDIAGETLTRIFRAPAVVLIERGDKFTSHTPDVGAGLSPSETEAARWALANKLPTRGENFPFDTSRFDFWPIRGASAQGVVLGIDLTKGRDDGPPDPERYVEMVGAYLAAGLAQDERGRTRA